jgi:DNA modification methylase
MVRMFAQAAVFAQSQTVDILCGVRGGGARRVDRGGGAMIDLSLRWQVAEGDCLDVMRSLPDGCVDAVVTDPPYGLAFMGKRWDYDVPSQDIWAEALRVLKPGGHLLAFAGTRTQHRMAVRIEDAGFEIRDMIAWVYGSGFPKSHNLDGDWHGWGTALKPSFEPLTVARKPLTGTVAANVLAHGTGALNVDGCRVGIDDAERDVIDSRSGRLPHGRVCGSGETVGAWMGRGEGTFKSHLSGRWPANLIHDGSEEVVGLFPQTGAGVVPARRNGDKDRNAYGSFNGQQYVPNAGKTDSGSAARFFYCAKASKADRDAGLEGMELRKSSKMHNGLVSCVGHPNPNARGTTESGDRMARNHHPTVKPTDLMRYLCRLVTPPNGIVLDPFTGSGSTGKAAMLEGFRFLGIEREAAYAEIARKRIAHVATQPTLFDGEAT